MKLNNGSQWYVPSNLARRCAVAIAVIAAFAHPAAAEPERPKPTGAARGVGDTPRGLIEEFEGDNEDPATIAAINFEAAQAQLGIGSLTPGDSDYYRINLNAGDLITVVTAPIESLPGGFSNPDTIIQVRNSANTVLVSDDDSGSSFPGSTSFGSVIRFRAASNGTYFVTVQGFNNVQTGRYLLGVARVNTSLWSETFNNTFDTADVISAAVGPSVGSAATEGDGWVDNFGLDLHAGDVVLATIVPIGNLPNDWSSPDPLLELIDINQSTVLSSSIDDTAGQLPAGSSTAGCTIRFSAQDTGRYFLRVTDEESPASDGDGYSVVTWRLPAPFCKGDADGSGVVNFADLTNVLLNFNNVCN